MMLKLFGIMKQISKLIISFFAIVLFNYCFSSKLIDEDNTSLEYVIEGSFILLKPISPDDQIILEYGLVPFEDGEIKWEKGVFEICGSIKSEKSVSKNILSNSEIMLDTLTVFKQCPPSNLEENRYIRMLFDEMEGEGIDYGSVRHKIIKLK